MYLPQRDDVPLCRDKAVQSGVVSGPWGKEERVIREDRQRQPARMATLKRRCTNLGEATDKVRDLPGYIHFVSPVAVYSLGFFFLPSAVRLLISPASRSVFPLRAGLKAGSPGESRAMTK